MADQKKKILTIEAIRGGAAIYVMLGHIVLLYKPYTFFPSYEFITKTIFGYGHQAVLLFFIVSGFSITYSSGISDFSDRQNLRDYLFKRFRRIYPLFIIALLISLFVLLITGTDSDYKRIILSFFFLTDLGPGSIVAPIPTNPPIWSLSYEIVYYFLFPVMLLLWKRIGQKATFIWFLMAGIVAGLAGFAGWPNHIFNLLQYYWFWIAGAMLAEAYLNNRKFRFSFSKGLIVSSVGLMLTIEKIPIVSHWLWTLFFILIFLLFYSDKKELSKRERILNFIIGIFSLVVCYFFTYSGKIVYHADLLRIIIPGLALASVFIYFLPLETLRNTVRMLLGPFTRSGSFSYALYIVHWPLINLAVFLLNKYLNPSFIILFTIIMVNILIIFLTSWFLEEKLQPVLARRLNKWYYQK
jgi:peptidoglycan/LPS O-acetylase OafA/YrhL